MDRDDAPWYGLGIGAVVVVWLLMVTAVPVGLQLWMFLFR